MSSGYRSVLDNMAGRVAQPAGADQAGSGKMSADILNNIYLLQNDLRILTNKVSTRIPFLKSTQTSWRTCRILWYTRIYSVHLDLTRFNKIAIQGTPQMAVDKEVIRLSRVYSYDSKYTCPYSMCNPP